MKRHLYRLWLALCSTALLLMTGCAALGPYGEEPTVTLSSFEAMPSEGMVPSFEVGLRIINPNPQTINLAGIVYTISLDGHELVKGVGKDFPPVEGYSEAVVNLTASANLLAGIRFIGDLVNSPAEELTYEFEAKLDLSGLYPSIRVREEGKLDMTEFR